ncbi:hypothetical protein [Kitasatospora sp. NPDC056181]|uniref:hypothetical protein n=1 Tax=Kitasatospora sp. NPDC056181 TaxID=3345737 RepID=UPI0035E2CE10
MATRSTRSPRPAPLPGTAQLRLVTGDPETERKILDALREHFTVTEPSHYDGGRAYLQLDTRPPYEPPPSG